LAYWYEVSLAEGAAAAAFVIFIVGPAFADRLIPGEKRRSGGGDVEGDSDFDTDGGD
jgi:hypothetical protein